MIIFYKRYLYGKQKRYYNNRSKKQNQESVIEQTAKFSQEQLALSTEDLGISEATRELLAKIAY